MLVNQSALYNSEFSVPFVNNPRVDEKSPGLNPIVTSEIIKFTPIGPSPTEVVASQVRSLNPEQGIDSSPVTVRAY